MLRDIPVEYLESVTRVVQIMEERNTSEHASAVENYYIYSYTLSSSIYLLRFLYRDLCIRKIMYHDNNNVCILFYLH